MDEQSVRGMAGVGQVAARGLFATALTLSLVPSLAYASSENEGEAPSATNTEEASSQSETETASANDYTPVALSGLVGNASVNYDLSKIADGTYAGTAVADSSDTLNKGDEWNAEKYDVSVSVVVSGGKITKVEVANYDFLEGDDWDRMDRAVNGYTDRKNKVDYEGVVSQINTAGNTDKIDAVTTATISSNAIKAAVDNALQVAYDDQNKQAPAADEYTYGYAALTWAEYWANEGVYNAGDTSSDATLDSHNETDKGGFDVVSRATANHGPARGAFQCTSVFHTEEGTDIPVAYWQDGSTFVCPDGSTGTFAKKAISYQGASYTMSTYDLTGTRYVPVKVKTSDLDAFKAKYQFVANDETLYVGQIGSTAEGAMVPYTATANVTASTNGLKTVTNNGGSFQFSKAAAGSESGLKDQAQKSVDLSALNPDLKSGNSIGSFGEFIRLDFAGAGYGELGANMQSVTWTYYGNDSTYSTPLRTFGTKFAADNWMHSKNGIQLGLTESARCQLPENTDGTGYWKVTIHALGYADSSYTFQATSENILQEETPVTDETKQKLQDLYDKAAALNKDDYTAESWEASAIETERGEAKDLLAKENLGESEAAEQTQHLQAALDALVKAEAPKPADKTQLNAALDAAKKLTNNNGEYSSDSWKAFQEAMGAAQLTADDVTASDEAVTTALKNLNDAQAALQAGPRKNLEFAVSAAGSLNESDYTKASWKAFDGALSAAQDALSNQAATEAELQQAADALATAQAGLAKAPTSADRKALIDEIGAAGTLGKDAYTADSWKAYQAALDAAKAAANAEDPSAADIQKATADLAAARQALVESGSGSGSASGAGGTTGGSADGGNGSGAGTGTGSGDGSGNGDNAGTGSGNDGSGSDIGTGSDTGNQPADSASSQGASSDAPKTGDNALGIAGAFAAVAAAAAGAVAAARRRLLGK